MTHGPTSAACRALVLAPHGRDALVATGLLGEVGIAAQCCRDLDELAAALDEDAAFLVVTEEATRGADLRALVAWLEDQPSWSDLGSVVLTTRGGGPERNPGAARLSEALGNVTFIERPFHPSTFTSAARTALKGRLRQFEARARLDELRESQERLKIALTAGRLGAWELKLDTRGLSCSEDCKTIFGRAADEAFDYQDLLASTPGAERERIEAAVEASARSGEDFLIEHRFLRPDGSERWIESRARRVDDPATGGTSLVGVASDITDRKTSEERLRRLNETLEERVAERTAELKRAHASVLEEIAQRERAEDQLRQAQKMETIGQLTGGVAHDFNNLLMAVLGNLDLLHRRLADDAKATRLIEGAIQAAKRGASLTQRLLAFARRQDLRVEPVDLAALVRDLVPLLEKSVGPGIELEAELGEDLPLALVDANQVELALLNLVVNARDAMTEGGTISLAVGEESPPASLGLPPGRYLRLSVGDSGHGMDAETLRRAVEPFFSTKELGKGTGLGLSMIHGLAVQLKGALRLNSEPGRGTRAELWLPASTRAADARPSAEARHSAAEPAPRATILVVDDDPLVAMSIVDMLDDLGHEVLEANSGSKALALLKEGRPVDLLVTDYAMPGMTGAQLAKAVRDLLPGLPILLTTGFADLPDGDGLDLPRLAKPYEQEQLAAEIGKLLPSGPRAGSRPQA